MAGSLFDTIIQVVLWVGFFFVVGVLFSLVVDHAEKGGHDE